MKKQRIISVTLLCCHILYCEIVFSVLAIGNLQDFILKISFSILIGLVLSVLAGCFKDSINKKIYISIIFVVSTIFSIQLIYYKIFGTILSLYSCLHGTQIFYFSKEIITEILKNWYAILLFFIPFCIITFIIIKKIVLEKETKKSLLIKIGIILLVYIGIIGIIYLKSEENDLYSYKNVYYNLNNPSESFRKFGILNTIRLDLQRTLLNFKEKDFYEYENEDGTKEILDTDQYNMIDIDFDKLIKNETDEEIRQIHQYIKSQKPTKKNKYTGLYENKNLIVFVAESFSSLAIREDITPTLYKMKTQGIQFENFYTPIFPVSTADGEYLTDTSLLPAEGVWSIENVAGNRMSFSYANCLREKGYNSYAYHNYKYNYYKRDNYLKTMGYDRYLAFGNGLEKKMDSSKTPSSDYEMIKATVKDYINEDKFLAYYVTMSGHMEYDKSNDIVLKNWEKVKNLPYSDNVKGYLATQIELDKALKELINQLEENNKLEDTVIIITGDHYPYSLTEEEIKPLLGCNSDDYIFERFHMPFIIYNGDNSKNIIVEKYGSNLDVLPTMLNLMGVDYDSRLLMGKDLLSDVDPLVIFSDRSFITKNGRYNSYTMESYPFMEKAYIERVKKEIYHKYKYSRLILEKNYYETLY